PERLRDSEGGVERACRMAQTEIPRLRAGGAPLRISPAGSRSPATRDRSRPQSGSTQNPQPSKEAWGFESPSRHHLPEIFQRSQGSLSQFQSAAPLTLLSLGNVCNEKTWNTIAPRKVLTCGVINAPVFTFLSSACGNSVLRSQLCPPSGRDCGERCQYRLGFF